MHVHFSGLEGFKVFLYFIVFVGTANLLAMKFRDSSSFAASWANLFGLS